MYSEITESLFKSIVTKETKCIDAIQLDHAFKNNVFCSRCSTAKS